MSLIQNMPADEYHKRHEISRGMLVDFIESPLGYFMKHVNKDPSWRTESTKEMDDGNLLHTLVLERPELVWEQPQSFGDIRVYPREVLNKNGGRGTTACKDWEAENEGKILRKQEDLADIWLWARMLQKGLPGQYLSHASRKIEQTILWSHAVPDGTLMECRSRLDLVIPGERIVDVKTCAKGDINDIENVIARSGYDFQSAYYQMAYESETGQRLPFTFVFIEKPKPHRTSVWTMDQDWVDEQRFVVEKTLAELKATADREEWAHPLQNMEMIARKPRWKFYEYQKVGD